MRLVTILILAALPLAVAQGAPPPSPEQNGKLARDDPNYVRCRQIGETGSLVRKQKICRTNAEWKRASENGARTASDILENGRSCAGDTSCRGS
jgi:hypothetical protein